MANKDIDIELKLLAPPSESDLTMSEQMKNKKEYEKQVDSLCIQSDELIRELKFDESLFKLIEAYTIVTSHPWAIKQSQIYDLIQNTELKRQDHLKKQKFRLQQQKVKQLEEQKQQQLIKSHQQELEKKQHDKENKLKLIHDLKQKEEEISNQAYKLLGEGQPLLKNQQYDEVIAKYREAKNLFIQIKWNGEAKKLEDSIQDFEKQKQFIVQKQEKERLLRQEQEREWKTKEQQLSKKNEQDPVVDEQRKKKLQESHSRKELEKQVYSKLDDAADYEKSSDLSKAVQSYEDAKIIMERLGWKQEVSTLNNSINALLNKLKTHADIQKREQLSKQIKEQEEKNLQKRIIEQQEDQKKQETERQRKLRGIEEKREHEQATSEKAFQQIEDVEKEAKYYKEHAKIDKFAIDCPYSRAKEVYENSRDLLLSIGWKSEARKLSAAISMYEKLYQKDQKERLIYNKRRDNELIEEEALEESVRLQKKIKEREEQKRKKKLLAQGRKKAQITVIGEEAFHQIEEIEKTVKYYKENAITKNYELECPYLQARAVYKKSQDQLLSIGWKEEADKLNSSISLYENLHLKDQKERATILLKNKKEEIDQQHLEETIQAQKEEKERQEQERIQKLQQVGKKKDYEELVSKRAFARIEELEKDVKYYKEHVIAQKFALDCPYLRAMEIYKTSREELLSIRWKKEADKLLTSISAYEQLYKKDQHEREKVNLLKQKRLEEEKELEESIRLQKEEGQRKEQERLELLKVQDEKKEQEEEVSRLAFQKIEEIEKEVKYYKEHVITEQYRLQCPYLQAIQVYQASRDQLLNIGWKKEADKLLTSISAYEQFYKKDQHEREKVNLLKQKRLEEEKELEESIRLQKEEGQRKEQERLELLKVQDEKKEQEEEVSRLAFQKIEEIEKEVKYYKEHVIAEQYRLQCPYLQAIQVYQASREQLLNIGWKKEADKLHVSISLYDKLARNDEKEREKFLKKRQKDEEEQIKLEESIRLQKEEQEKQERERLRVLREQNQQKQHESEIGEEAFHIIEEIEKEVAYYKDRVKIESYNLPCPYQRAKDIYRQAREMLLKIGWKKEADKLTHSISVYTKLEKEDLEIRDKFRKRLEKEKQEEQDLQETIRKERERLFQEEEKRKTEKEQINQKKKENEELQQVAYNKLEEGNTFIQNKDFDKATEQLNDALKIFKKIKWKNGVKLTEDAIKYKENEREKFEKLLRRESLALQEQKKKEREFQEFIEEQRRQKEQEEQNRKLELLRMDMEGKKIGEKQELAFKKLEEGNDLGKIREFKKANTLYLEALNIFREIGWIDGVEKTKEAISHNTLEQDRYNQHIELQKRQEKEKAQEERELSELIKQRQALTKLEEEQRRLKFEQQHELAEKIKNRQQEASALLEQGNAMIIQRNFDEADKIFLNALKIFKDINWEHGIKIANDVIKHNAEERKRFEQIKLRDEKARLEQMKQQKELENMLIEQKRITEQEAQLKHLKQQEQSDKQSQIQSMQEEARKYLEQGNQEISKREFGQARKLFSIAMKIFQGMGWQNGIEMVNNALDYNEKELVKFNNEKLREEQKQKEALVRQQEINTLIQESKEEEVKKQLEWKQKLEDKTRRLDEENQVKDQIFTLLEKGSKLAAKNEFLTAIDHYKKTIPLFENISWPLKRDQIIDLIDTTQQEYDSYRAHLAKEDALRQKQIQEEEELQELIKSEKAKEAVRRKDIQQKQLEQMEKDKITEGLKKEASEEIHKASVMLERRKFVKALDSLTIALENFKKLGWTKEAQTTEEQIAEVQRQKRETYKPIDRDKSASDSQVSEKGYNRIDEADKLIRQKKYKEALPFLEEAKQLFDKIQWKKALKMVEIRIRTTERLDKEKDELIEKLKARRSRKTEKEAYRLLDKVDKFRRESHYDYALTSVKEAHKIFVEIGWESEANDLLPLIDTITNEINNQKKTREKDSGIRAEKIKIEEEEDKKIQEIIEDRRRRRREAREKLKQD